MQIIIKRVDFIEKVWIKDDFIAKYKEAFEGLGTLKEKYTKNVDDKCKTVAKPARRIPFKIKPKLKEKLADLHQKGNK